MAAQLTEIREGKEKLKTAQVLKICYRFKYNHHVNPTSFCLIHERFIQTEAVLRPHIYPVYISEDVARFIELDQQMSSEILNTRKHPIRSHALTANAVKVIDVPRKDLDRIVSQLPDDRRRVVWMFHTTRCGSTVWSQIFNSLPDWTVFSEPDTHFYRMIYLESDFDYEKLTQTKQYEDMVVSSIQLYLNLAPKDNNIFWKATITDYHMIPIIQKRFPHHKILFSYRDVLPSGKSYFKAFANLDLMRFVVYYVLNPWLPRGSDEDRIHACWMAFTNGFSKTRCLTAIRSALPDPGVMEWFVLFWASTITMVQEQQRSGLKIKSIKYEDMQTEPAKVINEVFKYVDIPTNFVELGLEATEKDSQAGLHFDQQHRKKNPAWVRTSESVRKCNAVLSAFDLPDLDSSFTFD